jgi:hypothetical protein
MAVGDGGHKAMGYLLTSSPYSDSRTKVRFQAAGDDLFKELQEQVELLKTPDAEALSKRHWWYHLPISVDASSPL